MTSICPIITKPRRSCSVKWKSRQICSKMSENVEFFWLFQKLTILAKNYPNKLETSAMAMVKFLPSKLLLFISYTRSQQMLLERSIIFVHDNDWNRWINHFFLSPSCFYTLNFTKWCKFTHQFSQIEIPSLSSPIKFLMSFRWVNKQS